MTSHKEKFKKWAKDNNIELFDRLSEVMPDSPYDLQVGQTCTFRNYCFCDFLGLTIMGFCKPALNGRSVYLNYDCYWMPVRPICILLDGTKDQQCSVEITWERKSIILDINRVRCVLQSYGKNEYVNLSPIQTGLETDEEKLNNIRIDFVNNTFDSDKYKSVKWHNFTQTIDIEKIRKAIQQIESSKYPVCSSIRVRNDFDFPETIRCCEDCGNEFTTCGDITLNSKKDVE